MALRREQIAEPLIGAAFEVYGFLDYSFREWHFDYYGGRLQVAAMHPCFIRVSSVFNPWPWQDCRERLRM